MARGSASSVACVRTAAGGCAGAPWPVGCGSTFVVGIRPRLDTTGRGRAASGDGARTTPTARVGGGAERVEWAVGGAASLATLAPAAVTSIPRACAAAGTGAASRAGTGAGVTV